MDLSSQGPHTNYTSVLLSYSCHHFMHKPVEKYQLTSGPIPRLTTDCEKTVLILCMNGYTL